MEGVSSLLTSMVSSLSPSRHRSVMSARKMEKPPSWVVATVPFTLTVASSAAASTSTYTRPPESGCTGFLKVRLYTPVVRR